MGKVLELVTGFDGKIRSVKVKQGNGSVEYHSICNLYPLELSITHPVRSENINNVNQANNKSNDVNINETNQSVRPKRKAAEKFRQMIRDNIEHL